MSVVLVAKIKAKAGSEQKVEEAFRAMIGKVRAESGTETYVLHRAVEDPTTFVFYEVYRDQAAFEAHGKTPHMAELGNALRGNLDGRPELKFLTELDRK